MTDFLIYYLASGILGFLLGMWCEHWRTSPLRRIRQKYRAERAAARR